MSSVATEHPDDMGRLAEIYTSKGWDDSQTGHMSP